MNAVQRNRIINCLYKANKCCTYTAIAEVVGGSNRTVMRDLEMTLLNSVVVSKKTGLPTGYPDGMIAEHVKTAAKAGAHKGNGNAKLTFVSGKELSKWVSGNCR